MFVLERLRASPDSAKEFTLDAGTASSMAVVVTRSQDPERVWPHLQLLGWLSNAVLLLVVLLDTLHFSPHSDNLWQLNLVRQLRQNSRAAATLVDANRIFPDLVVAAGLDRLWHALGFELSGTAYVRCVVVLNVVLLVLISDAVRRRFGAVAGTTTSALLLLLVSTNEYFLEIIRPGFHTTASLILLIWMFRRFIPHRPLASGDILLLTALCISSRIFLVMVIVPCLMAQFAFSPSGVRVRRCLPLVAAGLLSTVGWLAIRFVPHLYIVAFDSSPHFAILGGLPSEFARNATGRPFMGQSTPLWVRCSWLYLVTAGVTVVAAVLAILARGRFRLRADTRQLSTVVGLSLVIGSVIMRMVNYVVEGRMYVLMLPIVGSVVCVSPVLHEVTSRWSFSKPRGSIFGRVLVVILVCVATVCGIGNSVALASSGKHDRYPTVAALQIGRAHV